MSKLTQKQITCNLTVMKGLDRKCELQMCHRIRQCDEQIYEEKSAHFRSCLL